MKTCNECGKSKPNSEYFSAPSYQCKNCKREIGRARYAPIKAAVKAKRLECYRDGLKRCRLCKTYKPTTEYYQHIDHWDRLEHECKICSSEQARKVYAASKEKRREQGRTYYQNHKQYTLDRNKKWRKDNPDSSHAIWHRYRSHQMDVGGSFTSVQWNALVKFYSPDSLCLRCHKKRKLHKDHVVPLSKGGTNTIGNIQPICQSCNSTKHTHGTDYRTDKGAFAKSLE